WLARHLRRQRRESEFPVSQQRQWNLYRNRPAVRHVAERGGTRSIRDGRSRGRLRRQWALRYLRHELLRRYEYSLSEPRKIVICGCNFDLGLRRDFAAVSRLGRRLRGLR